MTLAWLVAFVWTLAVEIPIYTLARVPLRLAIAVNAATHPALWLVLPHLPAGEATIAAAELAVVVVEATILALALRDVRRAFVASALANACSYVAGVVLWRALL